MNKLDNAYIEKAYERIKGKILKTPLIFNEYISRLTNAEVFFKLENLQWTGSFKLRGAMNKISLLSSSEKKNGVVAYSSGNHAQAVAYASQLHNINSTIIMPSNAPQIKINNTKNYGAKIILYDPTKESREDIGEKIANDQNLTLIKPYDDIDIIAGQGTCGKEIFEDLFDLNITPDLYLCCCGGGGLIAGTSTYLKNKFSNLECYSVEPENFNDTQVSLNKKSITANKGNSFSICDALLAQQPGDITFQINKKNLKGGLSVSDEQVKKTIIELAENLKIIVEPGGAVAACALLNRKIETKNRIIVITISGGNIDNEMFSQIIKEV